MFTQRSRHRLLQRLFWNPVGAWFVTRFARFEQRFDTAVRGYSLISHSNGESWLITLADPKGVMLDVGFNTGESTTGFLEMHPDARIHAFDPAGIGLRNYESRYADDPRITFTACAMAAEPGELTFYDYDSGRNSLARQQGLAPETADVKTVPVRTLDAYVAEAGIDRAGFLKIDVEGFEIDVLEGAHGLLENQRIDMAMLEFGPAWASSKRYLWEAVEFFEPLPYRLFRLFNGFLVPLVYDLYSDSCTTRAFMLVAVSEDRLARGDIPTRDYRF